MHMMVEEEDSFDRTLFTHRQNEGYSDEPLSEEVILSNRGLSQLLPTQIQDDLEQHIIIQSSSNSEIATDEVELQTQVLDVEACESQTEVGEHEVLQVGEEPVFDDQVPEEAVEVTVWSTMDETAGANQEIVNYGATEMVNLSSRGSRYKVKKHAVVISREGDDSSRELFSQAEVPPLSKTVQGEAVRTSGPMETFCSVDVVTSLSPLVTGSSVSLFSSPSGQQRTEQQQEAEVREEENVASEEPQVEQVSSPKSLPATPTLNGVIPHRSSYTLPGFLANLGSLVKAAVWFKAPDKSADKDPPAPRTTGSILREFEVDQRVVMTESDTDAEMNIVHSNRSRQAETSESDTEDATEMEVEKAEEQDVGKETDETMDSEVVEGEEVDVRDETNAPMDMEERGGNVMNVEKMDIAEANVVIQETQSVDVVGSWSPRELVVGHESSKDSTGNITMGTPHYSQPPFQAMASAEETGGTRQHSEREAGQPAGEKPQHGEEEQEKLEPDFKDPSATTTSPSKTTTISPKTTTTSPRKTISASPSKTTTSSARSPKQNRKHRQYSHSPCSSLSTLPKQLAQSFSHAKAHVDTPSVDMVGSSLSERSIKDHQKHRSLLVNEGKAKATTGEDTTGAPHYSQPFVPMTSAEETAKIQCNVREAEQLRGGEMQHGEEEQEVRKVGQLVEKADLVRGQKEDVHEEAVEGESLEQEENVQQEGEEILEEEVVLEEDDDRNIQEDYQMEQWMSGAGHQAGRAGLGAIHEEDVQEGEEQRQYVRIVEEEEDMEEGEEVEGEEEEEDLTEELEEEEDGEEEDDLRSEHEDIEDGGMDPVEDEVEEEDEIPDQNSEDVSATITTSPSRITTTSSSHSLKRKRNRRQYFHSSRSSLSTFPLQSFQSFPHITPLSSSPSLQISNTPSEIASIIHATYMSAALQNSRLTTPTLTDLWKHKSSSVSLQSSFEST